MGLEGAARLVLRRVAFIYCNDILRVQCSQCKYSHKTWACLEFNLSHSEWASSLRGCVMPGRIQFFTGEDCRADMSVTEENIAEVRGLYRKIYGTECIAVYNGIADGTLSEAWTPIFRYDFKYCGWESCRLSAQ